MEVSGKQVALAFAVVAVACVVAGAGLAWFTVRRADRRPLPAVPPSTMTQTRPSTRTTPTGSPQTRPSIMEPAKNVTIVGRAVCSSCSLGIGPQNEHHVYLVAENPYRTFEVLPNAQLEKLVGITGACAAGNYEVTARGEVRVGEGRNAILLSQFSTRQVVPVPTE